MPASKFSPEQRQQIKLDRDSGMSIPDIMQKHSIGSKQTIYNICKKLDASTDAPPNPISQREEDITQPDPEDENQAVSLEFTSDMLPAEFDPKNMLGYIDEVKQQQEQSKKIALPGITLSLIHI